MVKIKTSEELIKRVESCATCLDNKFHAKNGKKLLSSAVVLGVYLVIVMLY